MKPVLTSRQIASQKYYRTHKTKSLAASKAWTSRNRAIVNARQVVRSAVGKARDPLYYRKKNLRQSHGLTTDDYDAMLAAQSGLCAVCCAPERIVHPATKRPQPLCVDHDHRTGHTRGLLCSRCNSTLGYVDDNILILHAMIAYLENHNVST